MPKPEITDFRIAEATRLIALKFDQDFDFNRLAESLNLSPSRLRQLFKEETGMSFRKYLRLVRLREAKRLLETSFLSLHEIAEQVGIHDISHFVKDFKKQFEIPPETYRRKHHSAKEKSVSEK